MSSFKKGVVALVASLGAISLGSVAVASFPSAAGAAGGKAIVTLGKQAQLFARGAAVGVPVHITCDAPSVPTGQSLSQNVSVQVSEVVAGDVVVQAGYGSASDFICDGSPHSSTVYVIPNGAAAPFGGGAAHPFTDGTAFASAQLSVCSLPGIFPPTAAPFASPMPPPSPLPSPIPSLPGLPSCQSGQHQTVISIVGDNEG
jgi:hypothetical protein